MRKLFAELLYKQMQVNKNIWLLTGDLGYNVFDNIRRDFTDRFINVGAAEQAMIDIGIGLALEGKIPFCYSITPFLLYRPFESLRIYINHESIPVKLIGSGRDDDYKHDGFSHFAGDDMDFMQHFKNILSYHPNEEELPQLMEEIASNNKPVYLNLSR